MQSSDSPTGWLTVADQIDVGTLVSQCENQMGNGDAYGNAVAWNNHCYYMSAQTMNVTTAMSFCESSGGFLATIGEDSENDIISTLLSTTQAFDKSKLPAFIGYTDVGSFGKFRWMSGEILLGEDGKKYEQIKQSSGTGYLGHGHTDNKHTKHCTVIGYDGTWDIADCDSMQLAMCERSRGN
jgi:hypothetical protein